MKFTILILALLMSNLSYANPYAYNQSESYYQPEANSVPSPVALLEQSLGKVFYFLSQPLPDNNDAITDFAISEIAPNFDFRYMSRWVAGRYFNRMNPAQQQSFEEKFKQAFISNLVEKLTTYGNTVPSPGYYKSRQLSAHEAMASVNINYAQSKSVMVDFRYISTPSGWKAIDVQANGISALLYYRNYFSEQLRYSL